MLVRGNAAVSTYFRPLPVLPSPRQYGYGETTGPSGRGHLALALLTIIKRDRYASAPVVDRQVNGVSLTSQASKLDSSGLEVKVSTLP